MGKKKMTEKMRIFDNANAIYPMLDQRFKDLSGSEVDIFFLAC